MLFAYKSAELVHHFLIFENPITCTSDFQSFLAH
jgi:hypothetical protein